MPHIFSPRVLGMSMQIIIIIIILAITMAEAASPPPPVTPRQIFQFADGTNLENIHVRGDGTLLLSSLTTGDLLTIDPTSPSPSPRVVANLTGSTGVTGIATLDAGGSLFAVSGGIHTSFNFVSGSMAVYVVSLPAGSTTGIVQDRISVNATLNGMDALEGSTETVLSADSLGGRVLRINTRTRVVDVVLDDPILGPGATFPLGINGLKIHDGYVYFTNSGQGLFARVKIDGEGNQDGEFEVVARNPQTPAASNAYDDFAFDALGNAYVSLHSYAFVKITPEGNQTTWVGSVGNYSDVWEPSAAAASSDGKVIYLSTAGVTFDGKVEGGQVLEVVVGC
ncbi:hypothetical protein LAWI1_G001362 [Lachnellula willkommii]|uniref:SMP-30/Gluconolactonase/LRE-like region domain-containing protein n=1 Tax=Lachnellula willkommii TaxID=215461 RepID=A0A559MMI2_9HELO|nr:hypothetical protein LAWI1_G001362 [Lachnellula willkommii]